MRMRLTEAHLAWVAVILLSQVGSRQAGAQGVLGVMAGPVVLPAHSDGTAARQIGVSVYTAGRNKPSAVLELSYMTSWHNVTYFPPCPAPGCTGPRVERSRTELIAMGPAFVAPLFGSRVAARVGADLLHQRFQAATSWQADLTVGADLLLWQRSRTSVALRMALRQFVTGGAFARWLVPVSIELTL